MASPSRKPSIDISNIHSRNNKGQTALHLAAKHNLVKEINHLLSCGARVDAIDKNSRTPLHIAAYVNKGHSHFAAMSALLTNRANANARTSSGNTPLHYLAFEASACAVELLFNFGAKVNLPNCKGDVPLVNAVFGDNVDVVRQLVKRGSPIRSDLLLKVAEWSDGNSHVEVADILLERGASVNFRDWHMIGPIYHAIKAKNFRLVELFFRYNPILVGYNKDGEIPLVEAIRSGHQGIIGLFRDHGSSVDSVDHFGMTVLHRACVTWDYETVKALVKHGADPNALDYQSHTPLMKLLSMKPLGRFTKDFEKALAFLLKYTDMHVLEAQAFNVLEVHWFQGPNKVVLKYFAKVQSLGQFVVQSVLDSISRRRDLYTHFKVCIDELNLAKTTKIQNTWVTYFDLLTNNWRKLKNYAGNKDLKKGFKIPDYKARFPIYGAEIVKRVSKAKKTRESFDKSSIALSKILPVFNPNHLIIRDVLDCLGFQDFLKLL